jgi:hypothetical protein
MSMTSSLEETFSAHALGHCERALDASTFFRALAAGAIDAPVMRRVFSQYRFFRDQLHRWFGLCIVKAPSCRDPNQKAAIMALAEHIFTDLRDGHDEMFDAFLRDLGTAGADAAAARPNEVALRYIQSFLDEFGASEGDCFVAIALLAGRELCVSARNQRFVRDYFAPRGLPPSTWIALHARLELDHFRDVVRPALSAHAGDASAQAAIRSAVERGIDGHVRLFDDLLR